MIHEFPFRTDNTEGYSESELAQLNRLYRENGGLLLPPGDEEKTFCERLLTWYDSRPQARLAQDLPG